ncbi:MAG: Catalytic domain of component of various dehydrogenase complexe [Nitrosospira multiformis]|jgi:pyruvate/2-oxoglutarate dehydrogenase complex dihydrolipoamide acyltransferase (E2) component|nr:Catalytic domain of component of various dehydrogenase complexe [Nitrosospira multiformis]
MDHQYTTLERNRYFEVLGNLNAENRGDNKVAMLSELDMTSAQALRAAANRQTGIKPSYTAIVAKAISIALREHPYANRMTIERLFWKRILQLHDVHMSVMVERDHPGAEQIAFAATIRNSDILDVVAITQELQLLTKATEENNPRWRLFKRVVEILPPTLASWLVSIPRWFPKQWIEHRGGAVLISSPAKYGVDMMVGNWPWPIGYSFGLVKDRVIAVGGEIKIRPTMTLTMSFDRRLMGGAPAARFFRAVCSHIECAERDMVVHPIQDKTTPSVPDEFKMRKKV